MWPNPQFLRIWPHLLKKSLVENFIFCVELDNRSATFPKQTLQQQLIPSLVPRTILKNFFSFSYSVGMLWGRGWLILWKFPEIFKRVASFEEKEGAASTVAIDYTSLLQMQNKMKYPNFLFWPKSASFGKYSKTQEGPKLRKVSK